MSVLSHEAPVDARWRALRRAVREAHALGTEFRIRGAAIEIDGAQRLPERLLEALDPDLLYEYFGAAQDDEETVAFLETLGATAELVTSVEEAQASELRLAATKSLRVGIDIETTAKPEFVERRPRIPINVDGSVSDRAKQKRDKAHRPPELDPHRADIATLQLYSGGPVAFVFRGDALRHILGLSLAAQAKARRT